MPATVTRLHTTSAPAAADATARFLRRDRFEPTTRQAYGRTLAKLVDAVGRDTSVAAITAEQVEDLLHEHWDRTAATTYNRHLAALGAFFGWAADRGWITHNPTAVIEARKVRRRSEDEKRDRPIATDLLTALWAGDFPLREKALWRMAYESWARADELLRLDVGDLNLAEREAHVHAKGGDVEAIWWATGTARLLPKLIAHRAAGPVFLAERAPTRPMPAADLDPGSGRARLSYRQAERLFAAAGQHLDPDGAPWTFHRLRHSGISHAVEQGWNLGQIRAKSRHKSLRSLEVYANPSAESVRAMTAALDPEARRSH